MLPATPLSETKRRLMDRYLQTGAVLPATRESAITPRGSQDEAPVSLSQEQLLVRETRRKDIPPLHNECIKLQILEPLDVSILEDAFTQVLCRHEIWRTSYVERNGRFVQLVRSAPKQSHFQVIDLRKFPRDQKGELSRGAVRGLLTEPFDLAAGPLLRTQLIRLEDYEYHFYIVAHLSIVDGLSAYQLFPRELSVLYRSLRCKEPASLPTLDIQFRDYACWQRRWMQSEDCALQAEYWRKQLDGMLPTLNWPNRRRSYAQTFCGTIDSFLLNQPIYMALKESVQREGVSTFTEIAAAFAILMHCYTEQEDIIVETPAPAGRKRSQLQTMLGYFLNPVPLRFDFTGDPTVRDILHQTQRIILEALSNDEIPVQVIAEQLKGDMDLSRNACRTGISLQPPMAQVGRPWRVTSMDVDSGGSPWELYLAFIEGSDGMVARVQYNPHIFDRRTVDSMVEDFQKVLEYIAANKLYRLSDAKYLLAKSSAPASDTPVESCT